MLWPGEASGNPDMALRAILHRFRIMVDQEGLKPLQHCIMTNRGSYQWNPNLNCELDLDQIDSLFEQAEYEQGEPARAGLYERMLALYAGKLLPGSAGEVWVERRSVEAHARYKAVLFHLLDYYKKQKNDPAVIETCRRAMQVDQFDEHLQMELVMALERTGQAQAAQEVCDRAANLGYRHLTGRPRALNSAYRQLMQADRNIETDIDAIGTALLQNDAQPGAFVCDYTTFQEIYRLHLRLQERYGNPMFLGLITIASPQRTADAAVTAEVMTALGEVLAKDLRRCDVAARYSATQYVLMLAGVTTETGANPMERIKAEFYGRQDHAGYLLSYRLRAPGSPYGDRTRRKAKAR